MNHLSLFITLLFSSCVFAEDYLELNKDNFQSTIEKLDFVLVKFYAEWCGHCKRMAPEFAKAATRLLKNNPPVHLVKVNCPDNEEVCSKFGVSGYPTLKMYKKGEFFGDYDGGREENDIVKYMSSRAGPSSTEMKKSDDYLSILDGEDSVFVAYVKDKDSSVLKTFTEFADKNRDTFKFLHYVDSDFVSKNGGKDLVRRYLPKKIQSKLEDSFLSWTDSDNKKLDKFAMENWGGELVWMKNMNDKLFIEDTWLVVFFDLDYERNQKGTNYHRNRFLKAIKEFRKSGSTLKFAMASVNANKHELSNKFGLMDAKSAALIIAKDGSKFVSSYEFSYENIINFAKDFEAGKLEAYIKSEPIPEKQDEAVVKVVGKSFNQVVNDNSKDVLIEFYAPWCGHCKSLKPIYEELATKFKDESDIVIAAMDATANDVPAAFNVRGFPTIYWVPKDKKSSPITYDGERTVEGFTQFIKKHATTPVKDEL